MELRSSGLILRTRPLTETSLIIHWLTPDQGRLATVAKGARRPKSIFRGKIDLFYLADFSFTRSRKSDLHNLREVVLREPHAELRRELGWVQQASYAATLVEQTTETETPLPEIYVLMLGLVSRLSRQPPTPRTILALELKLLELLGQLPEVTETKLSLGSREIVRNLTRGSWEELERLQLSAAQVQEISRFLHGFLIYHLERIPRGRAAALLASE